VLLVTAFIWGAAFVAQREGMEHLGPFLFVALRMLLGAVTLAIVLQLMRLFGRRRTGGMEPEQNLNGRQLAKAGLACGGILFFSSSFQQIGLVDIDAGKAGFLTALYIVLVPILGILLRKKTHWNAWAGVLVAAGGLYFLCIKRGQSIAFGDLITLVGALGWSCHILVVDHFVSGISQRDVLRLCVAQFLTAGALAALACPLFDGLFTAKVFSWAALVSAAPTYLYVGILSTGVAFTLQAVGQQGLNPTAAAIIMSLESVFAVICGMVLLGEIMSTREILGCVLVFAAVILSQLPIGEQRRT
ncbi:MAG: DMT family transporter, partial [Coriobacteriales bacterium]|nr:DMT family transporter [Coriobacteriales bacterium]